MPKVRLALLVAALVLALPTGAAAEASGELRVEEVKAAVGTLRASAGDLRWEGSGAPVLDVVAEAILVERFGHRSEMIGNTFRLNTNPYHDRFEHGPATLRLKPGEDGALVALRTNAPLDADLLKARLRAVAHASVARVTESARCNGHEPLCWEVDGATEASAARATVRLPRELHLALRGPALVVESDGEVARYASGESRRTENGVTTVESAWVVVTLVNATGTLLAEGDVALYAAAPALAAPDVVLVDATGRLDAGLRAYVARGEVMTLGGDLALAPEAVPPGRVERAERATYHDAFDVTIRGDVRAVSLRAMPLHESSPGAAVGLAAAILAALAALAWAWPLVQFHATSLALPLYTRLNPPRLLDNAVRNAIFEIIRANPGISARGVHRLSDQSWGTVVYHLRQLEKHHLVVSRALGRTRNYYENHGKYRGMEVQLACLRSERARVLARLVLASPGIAQEELAVRSAYPQPTTSYYVRKLKTAGLVEERRDGRYTRYHPSGDVGRFLEMAEADGAAGAGDASPA